MKVIKPQTLGLLSRPFEFKREFWLGVSVIAFMPVGERPILLPETSMWPFLTEELPPDQPLDAVIPKALPEFLAVAHAFAPEAVPAPQIGVGIQLGPIVKTLNIFGDRAIGGSRATEPIPFTTMPIDWAHAYGGAGFADNPTGKGVESIEGTDGRMFPLPNILDPKQRGAALRAPAGFGPVDQMWPVRATLNGTYDDNWLKQDFPGFARDIDWRFFNTAPQDQWLPGPLNGDETYAFKNLNLDKPLLRGRLPGLAPRLFLVRRDAPDDGGFEEVPLRLTTVWFFPHRERLVLVHHGQARLTEEDASDIARVVIGAERAGAERPVQHYHAVMTKRVAKGGGVHALRDEDLVPAEWLGPDPIQAAVDEAIAPIKQLLARQRRRAERQNEEMREGLRARGLDPDVYGPKPLPPDEPLPTMEELPALMAAKRAEADALRDQAESDLIARETAMAEDMAAAGVSPEEMRRQRGDKPRGPPRFSAAEMKAEAAGKVNWMRVMGIVAPELEAQLTDPETAASWEKAEVDLRNTYRLTAHQQDPADRLDAVRSAELRLLLYDDLDSARALYDLHGANLSGLDLSGVDLTGVCLDGCNLSRTSFAGAKLVNAVLSHARMDGCVLDGADLTGANLGKAVLTGASLRRAILDKAVLWGANLTNASFAGASMNGANLSGVIIADADFRDVQAANLLAVKLSLRLMHAPGIVLRRAKFIECDLGSADLSDANLEGAVFLKCNLDGIQLARARMVKTVFVEKCVLVDANLASADLSEANLRETDLRNVNLDEAILNKADLSGADLTEAILTYVRGADSKLVAAKLRHARLHGADFARADFARADLRGADLSGMSAFEANLARVKLDRFTVVSGMFRTRMRHLPLLENPRGARA